MASLRRILIIGAGGHGMVVAEAAEESQSWSHIEFIDDGYPDRRELAHWPVVGRFDSLPQLRSEADTAVVAIGDNERRLMLMARIAETDIPLATVVHPRACASRSAKIGAGTVLLANAVVNARTVVGRGCIINTAASVDHDCKLADGVHIAPGAHLAAGITVGKRALIGVGSSVRPRVRIGHDVVVGAGSAVVTDICDGATVAGVPARPVQHKSHGRTPDLPADKDFSKDG